MTRPHRKTINTKYRMSEKSLGIEKFFLPKQIALATTIEHNTLKFSVVDCCG